jgi:hypothetical protein
MGAFLISPLPSFLLEPLQTAGPLRSTGVTPLPRYYRPSRFPLAGHRLPGVTGYTASLLRRFLDGTRRVSPVAQHDLVTVLSLPTPPKWFAASVFCDAPCCLRPKSEGSAFGIGLSRPQTGSLALRPGDSLAIHEMALSIGFRIFSFLPSCYSSYWALTLTQVGLNSH